MAFYTLKMTARWDIALCNLVEEKQRFKDAYCFHHQGDLPR
jgi:hypothetical protein